MGEHSPEESKICVARLRGITIRSDSTVSLVKIENREIQNWKLSIVKCEIVKLEIVKWEIVNFSNWKYKNINIGNWKIVNWKTRKIGICPALTGRKTNYKHGFHNMC